MRILLVEDDPSTAQTIEAMLKKEDWVVDTTDMGEDGVEIGKLYEYDLVILDLMLPDMDGLEVLRQLRNAKVNTPVLILSGLTEPTKKVQGFGIGADDYLTKPFDLDELCARMRALQRRSKSRAKPIIVYNNITLDPASHVVKMDDETIMISRREFALLQKLLENAGRVISREQLNQPLYGWGENIDSNALEVHIHNLRKRFGTSLIRTIRGVGYMAEKPNEDD